MAEAAHIPWGWPLRGRFRPERGTIASLGLMICLALEIDAVLKIGLVLDIGLTLQRKALDAGKGRRRSRNFNAQA